MAFDSFKSFWNMDIKDGVRGSAYVRSATIPTESGTSGNVKMWLDIYVEGWEPYPRSTTAWSSAPSTPRPASRCR